MSNQVLDQKEAREDIRLAITQSVCHHEEHDKRYVSTYYGEGWHECSNCGAEVDSPERPE